VVLVIPSHVKELVVDSFELAVAVDNCSLHLHIGLEVNQFNHCSLHLHIGLGVNHLGLGCSHTSHHINFDLGYTYLF